MQSRVIQGANSCYLRGNTTCTVLFQLFSQTILAASLGPLVGPAQAGKRDRPAITTTESGVLTRVLTRSWLADRHRPWSGTSSIGDPPTRSRRPMFASIGVRSVRFIHREVPYALRDLRWRPCRATSARSPSRLRLRLARPLRLSRPPPMAPRRRPSPPSPSPRPRPRRPARRSPSLQPRRPPPGSPQRTSASATPIPTTRASW